MTPGTRRKPIRPKNSPPPEGNLLSALRHQLSALRHQLSAIRETFAPWREEKLARWVKIKASSKNTKFSNTMVQKFQFVKISGILRHHVSHGTRFRTNLAHFREILAPFRLMGRQFSRGLPKGGEAVQIVRQVFQADFGSRAPVCS